MPIEISHEPKCTVCHQRKAIYTCPRCSLRSCSVACSVSHKTAKNCSGERNRTVYVPMNQYTWGTMMNDYVFLEDVGRKVGNWGEEIVRGGYTMNAVGATNRGRRGASSARGKGTRTKRDILKTQLESQDIEMELLPPGMERKKMNQSYWDFKKNTGMLTIEFKLYAPVDTFAPPRETPFKMLTHRNDINTPLLTLVQKHLSKAKKDNIPPWAKSLVLLDTDNPGSFTTPCFVMPAPRDSYPTVELITHPNRPVYYRFDPMQPLSMSFKGTQFVEFPTIEVREEFNGIVVDAAGSVSRISEDQPKAKRRKLAQTALDGLLGEYGSDEEEQEKVPSVLVEYAESVSEEEDDEISENEGNETDDAGEDIKVDPAVLLELQRRARNSGRWTTQDEEVDWGDLSGDEPK